MAASLWLDEDYRHFTKAEVSFLEKLAGLLPGGVTLRATHEYGNTGPLLVAMDLRLATRMTVPPGISSGALQGTAERYRSMLAAEAAKVLPAFAPEVEEPPAPVASIPPVQTEPIPPRPLSELAGDAFFLEPEDILRLMEALDSFTTYHGDKTWVTGETWTEERWRPYLELSGALKAAMGVMGHYDHADSWLRTTLAEERRQFGQAVMHELHNLVKNTRLTRAELKTGMARAISDLAEKQIYEPKMAVKRNASE